MLAYSEEDDDGKVGWFDLLTKHLSEKGRRRICDWDRP